MKTYMTIGKVAKELGVSICTLRRWDKLGKLTAALNLQDFSIISDFNTKVVIINHEEDHFESRLAKDVLEIITVFSARLYGSRSHKNKKKLRTLTQYIVNRKDKKNRVVTTLWNSSLPGKKYTTLRP